MNFIVKHGTKITVLAISLMIAKNLLPISAVAGDIISIFLFFVVLTVVIARRMNNKKY